MPTMAPVLRLEELEVEDWMTVADVVAAWEADVDVADEVAPVAVVVRVGAASTGKYSKGLNSRVVFWVYRN